MLIEFEMTPNIRRALVFARVAHGTQKRETTGEPYIGHPIEVANLVASVGGSEEQIMAALLHDVIEDTEATDEDLVLFFGVGVASTVTWLSDISQPSDGNRAERKAIDRAHSHRAPDHVHTIKTADVISNMRSIHDLDIDFAKVYVKEKALLMKGLDKGDPILYSKATIAVDAAADELWRRKP